MSNTDLLGFERQERITKLLEQKGTLTVAEISHAFGVSEATARRDLAEQNIIRRVHGGAMRPHNVATSEAPILHRQEENAEIKQRIGKATARLIQDGETLLLVGGSTGTAVARELGDHRDLRVVTDSLIVANELMRQDVHKVIILGELVPAR